MAAFASIGTVIFLAAFGIIGYFVAKSLKYAQLRNRDPEGAELFRQKTEMSFQKIVKSRLWWLAALWPFG